MVTSKRAYSRLKAPKARTSGMLLTRSTISPSTPAAFSAKSWCSGLPAAAMRNISTTTPPQITIIPTAIGTLTLDTYRIEPNAAAQGGITFHTNMFSAVKIAFEVAVMRLASVPGCRSAK